MSDGPSSDASRISEFSEQIRDASADTVPEVLADFYHEDADWHGMAPIHEAEGRAAIAAEVWEPLLSAFPDLEKNDYLLFAGEFEGEEWVCTSGNLVGTFENDWLSIPATGHATWLRYGEFHRLEDGKIAETRTIIDVLDVLRQAGYRFVPALAPEIVAPGPTTQDGVILDERDDDESAQTMQLVEDMIFEGLDSFEDVGLDGMGLDEYWHEDFTWYGPAGIGTTRGIDGFQDFHQAPFLTAFPDRHPDDDDVRFATGNFCAWGGWPSMEATHSGDGWLGLPGTGETVTMRVMDFWRREGDRLAENWVLIDIIDILDQLGVDVFERLETNPRSVQR